jgi:hypothetical protein
LIPLRRRAPGIGLVLALVGALLPSASFAAPAGLRGVGVDEPLAEPPAFAELLGRLSGVRANLPLFARISVAREALEPTPGSFEFTALHERVAAYYRVGVRVVVDLGEVPQDASAAEAWKAFTRAVALRFKGRVRAYQLGVAPTASARDAGFLVQLASVEMRAADPDSLVVVAGLASASPEWRAAFYAEGLAPYVDALALDRTSAGAEDLTALLAREDPEAGLVVEGARLADEPQEAVRDLLQWQFSQLGGPACLATFRGTPGALEAVVRATDALADALFDEVVPLDPTATALRLEAPPGEPAVRTHLLYNTTRFSTYVAYWSESGPETTLALSLNEPSGRTPVVRDAASGRVRPVQGFAWDPASNRASMKVPVSTTPLLLDFGYGATEVKATRVDVTRRVLPPVGEIIFRNRQVQAAQDAVVHDYSATMRLAQHIRPSVTDPGYDVVTDNAFYWSRAAVEWEELTFSINGTKWGADRPPIPLVQPEKVNSLPLDLRLNADYTYRLEGVDSEAGRECYVVGFDPVDKQKPLYKGSVWIDSKTFERRKLRAVQTRPGAPVQSNEETHYYAAVGAASGRPVNLLARLVGKQIILVAGRNVLLEREVRFEGFKINGSDFEARRTGARRGAGVMYRDTEHGLRYLVKKGDERVVSEKATRSALALALGTIVDPSYDYPLPLVGINYLNFEFPGKNGQLAVLFAGVLALVNMQRPQILGPHVDLNFDLYAIAVWSRDKTFAEDGAIKGEELQTRPFSTGVNVGYQFTEFQKLTGSYQFRYDSFKGTKNTAASFVVPKSTVTNVLSVGYEYRRGGYSLQGSATYNRRNSWKPWGAEGDYDPKHRDYLKYQANLSKEFYGGLHKFRVNLGYFGGRDIDRFSSYQFGMYDETRIHGVPAAGVRFPELAVLRGSYSFNLLEMYRLDLFVDQALGRDPDPGTRWRSITGLGLGFNLHGPFRTLVRGEVGKSFLPKLYAGAGSWNAQITFFRPL